jgi:hypothetical protein
LYVRQTQSPRAARTMPSATLIFDFSGTALMPATLDFAEDRAQLLAALQAFAHAQPPEAFAGEFLLQGEMVQGCQAVVAIARECQDGFKQYAIRCDFDASSHAHSTPSAASALHSGSKSMRQR